MTTASELADELKAAALEMEMSEDTKPSFIATLRQAASALRQVEVMRGALERIANAKPDELLDEVNTGILKRAIKISRQTLTGEE